MDASATVMPTEPNRSVSFELLAPEVLLEIVTALPGLDTLWNLMRASPRTWRLYNRYALTITEGILSGPNSILPSSLPELIRGVVLVRSGILPFEDLQDFQLRFMQGQVSSVPLRGSRTSLSSELLAASIVPVATLRSVVATAYHVSALAQACLESCLVRIRDPGFRPMHAYDPPAQYLGHYMHNGQADENVRPEDRVFVGTPVNVVDAGEPSWIEEMRALRAMWIIQLMGEVQCLIEDRAETTGWSAKDVETLSSMDAVDLVRRCTSLQVEEVNTAMLYVRTLGNTTKNRYYRLPRAPSTIISARRTIISPKPSKDTPAVYGFRRDNEIHILTRGAPVPKDGEPVISSARLWCQAENNLFNASPGMNSFRDLTAGTAMMVSPLDGVEFDSFRPLGLAFWDRWRMYLLGLTWGGSSEWTVNGKRYMPFFYHFALESILPPEEVASVKAALREKRRRSRAQYLDSI